MFELQQASKNFSKKEESYGRSEVNLAFIYDLEGNQKTNIPHYTVIKDSTSLHATSNIKRIFDKDQRIDGAIPTLVKQNAIAPGTVITKGVSNIKKISHKSI
jgi:hypothetical protein